jgi:hypothetical protein
MMTFVSIERYLRFLGLKVENLLEKRGTRNFFEKKKGRNMKQLKILFK